MRAGGLFDGLVGSADGGDSRGEFTLRGTCSVRGGFEIAGFKNAPGEPVRRRGQIPYRK